MFYYQIKAWDELSLTQVMVTAIYPHLLLEIRWIASFPVQHSVRLWSQSDLAHLLKHTHRKSLIWGRWAVVSQGSSSVRALPSHRCVCLRLGW